LVKLYEPPPSFNINGSPLCEDWDKWRIDGGMRFRLFPVGKLAKIPAITDWPNRATNDIAQIEKWWSGEFRGHNVGIAAGRGLLVLDFDAKKGGRGLESLELMDMMGLLPEHTLRVRTPNGAHVYLWAPEGVKIKNGVRNLEGFPDVDVRSDGGYVLGPGSTIEGKEYVAY
jgi:hypothetical protein